MLSNWRSPPRPSEKSPEQGRPYNRRNREVGRRREGGGETGKSAEDERVAAKPGSRPKTRGWRRNREVGRRREGGGGSSDEAEQCPWSEGALPFATSPT